MALLANLDTLDRDGKKGDWCFVNDNEYMVLRWGNDVGDICMVRLAPEQDAAHWMWDGNKETPTISPSIRVYTQDKTLWHGFLNAGELITL